MIVSAAMNRNKVSYRPIDLGPASVTAIGYTTEVARNEPEMNTRATGRPNDLADAQLEKSDR
jgi:hypothetical protein